MEYWNHNTAYHQWILKRVQPGQRVLDVGCGEGLLLARLQEHGCIGLGLEPDAATARRARSRQVEVLETRFADFDAPPESFDAVCMVASLHHMPLVDTLVRARELLVPGGRLLVVGLAANKSWQDWTISALQLPLVRWRRDAHDINVPIAQPRQSLTEIRETAAAVLPGMQIRRGLYYRYLLHWHNAFRRFL